MRTTAIWGPPGPHSLSGPWAPPGKEGFSGCQVDCTAPSAPPASAEQSDIQADLNPPGAFKRRQARCGSPPIPWTSLLNPWLCSQQPSLLFVIRFPNRFLICLLRQTMSPMRRQAVWTRFPPCLAQTLYHLCGQMNEWRTVLYGSRSGA